MHLFYTFLVGSTCSSEVNVNCCLHLFPFNLPLVVPRTFCIRKLFFVFVV